MGKKTVAIVCNGKELSYGIPLSHMFKYVDEKEELFSAGAAEIESEIYSIKAFRHTSIPTSVIKVFIGDTKEVCSSCQKIFDVYGLSIAKTGTTMLVNADPKAFSQREYLDFLAFANTQRYNYLDTEKEYAENVQKRDKKWIPSEFTPIEIAGPFSAEKRLRRIRQQQFDCLAFVLYLGLMGTDYLEDRHRNG